MDSEYILTLVLSAIAGLIVIYIIYGLIKKAKKDTKDDDLNRKV